MFKKNFKSQVLAMRCSTRWTLSNTKLVDRH